MTPSTATNTPITDTNLEEFKKLVRKATFLDSSEEEVFKAIPNELWRNIFSKNFDGNFEYSKRVLLNQFKDIDKIDTALVDKEKNKIHNLSKACGMFEGFLEQKKPIVFITDFDNDGSLAQAVINEYLVIDKEAAKSCQVEYAQTMMGAARGVNVAHVDLIAQKNGWSQDSEFLIVTADNGINSQEEVAQIQQKYKNCSIIITDHHNPDSLMCVKENDKCVIFNPHYKPTAFYKKYNISGATTVGVLLKNVLEHRITPIELATYKNNLEKIGTLFKVSNMLDYVDTHAADKPEKDYIVTKFLQLQPLLNINNSISKIIVGQITPQAISALEKKIPNLDTQLLALEAKNINIQNHVAKVLLYINEQYGKNNVSNAQKLAAHNFQEIFLKEITNQQHFLEHSNINPNYIEQLRPLIFSLSADYDKNAFLDAMCQQMVAVFESIRVSERKIGQELRRGEVITKQKLPNSTIAYADEHILSVFNRKFLNKVYNDENPGFSLTLDSIKPSRVSGSFRSIFNISDIMPEKDKAALEKKLNVKIETPGHEKAAGFIVISRNPQKNPITEETIAQINDFVNNSIEKLKAQQKTSNKPYFLVDFNSITTIDKINKVIRGNLSNFEYINPIISLDENTVWTDSYTTQQMTLKEVAQNKKYGYVTINTDFHGGTIIVPVELIRKIVDRGYKDYFSLGYMDEGVFMVDRVVKQSDAKQIVNLCAENEKESVIEKAWQRDFSDKNSVNLTREQIKDNPFFKYNDYGSLNFDLFERIVIGVIDSNKVDILSVFDVEANGFGNSKIINLGATNYYIDAQSGVKVDKDRFFNNFYHTARGEEYLLTSDDVSALKAVSESEKEELPLDLRKELLIKSQVKQVTSPEDGEVEEQMSFTYYLHPSSSANKKQKSLPFTAIKNYALTADGKEVIFNREIKASMLAYLIKDKDFKMPQEMINLTGITQRLLDNYGKPTNVVDQEFSEFYKDKKVLFGAHNTPYDARVIRANLPKTYGTLKSNKIYDSALFAKEMKLAYDDVLLAYFEQVNGMPENIYFYNNEFSDFSIGKFLQQNKNGYFPDRSGDYLLEIDNGSYYLVDKIKHEKTKLLVADQQAMMNSLKISQIPNTSVKYSVEKLSEQWMIHALLLCDEKFNVAMVDLNNYPSLKKHKEAIEFFQDNYHFDISESKNIVNFMSHYNTLYEDSSAAEELYKMVKEFLTLNQKIQQKFADAWMYKKVLSIKDPTKQEVTVDLIELVHYQTNIPKDKIKTIFSDAIAFKDKYKISSVLYHEAHANGPWREDAKGDVAFEDKLTLGLLSQREYNSYEHSVKPAISYFNGVQLRAKIAFDVSDELSDELAQDSYSFRQGIQYERDTISDVVQSIKDKEAALASKSERYLVKYKLDNDILPEGTAIYALSKKHAVLCREDIEKHKKMFGFILLHMQSQNSLHNVIKNKSSAEVDAIKKIIEQNDLKALEYKIQLMDFYDYVEFNRKDYQIKQIIDNMKSRLLHGKEAQRKTKPKISNIDLNGLTLVEEVIEKLIKEIQSQGKLSDSQKKSISEVRQQMAQLIQEHKMTSLEQAVAGSKDSFLGFNNEFEIGEPNFLDKVDILRQDLGDRFLHKNPEFRLLNEYVWNTQELILSQKMKFKM